MKVLSRIPRVPDNPFVIPGRIKGKAMRNLNDPWEIVCDRAGLKDMRIHDCRHSYASRTLALGESLPMIDRLLGHTQVETTARYAHLAQDSVRDSGVRGLLAWADPDEEDGPIPPFWLEAPMLQTTISPDATPLEPGIAPLGASLSGFRLVNGDLVLKIEREPAAAQLRIPACCGFGPADGVLVQHYIHNVHGNRGIV